MKMGFYSIMVRYAHSVVQISLNGIHRGDGYGEGGTERMQQNLVYSKGKHNWGSKNSNNQLVRGDSIVTDSKCDNILNRVGIYKLLRFRQDEELIDMLMGTYLPNAVLMLCIMK